MTRSVELARIGFPFADPPDSPPHIGTAEYERRLDALWDSTDVDWIAVYGDPEHRGNLSYLCGVDPRFEEALLVLGRNSRRLIVGTEGRELAHQGPVPMETLWVPTLSGAGIDRGSGLTLREAIAAAGVERGHRVGVIGWKLLEPLEWAEQVPGIAAPAFVVDALRSAAGGADHVLDLTATLLDARDGQRFANSADQIAFFEWGASHAAAAVHGVITSARPGGSEAELATGMRYSGAPLSYHPVVASGPDLPAVLGRPGSRFVGRGEPVFVMVGVWGGNCARAGILGADEGDCRPDNPGYLARVAIPYWRAVAAWYEAMAVGRPAGDVLAEVTEACRRQGFQPALGVGHFVDWEDWPNTPFRDRSDAPIRSGTVVDCDIFSDRNGPAHMVHCEDTIAVADGALRAEIAERHPLVWSRFERRQRFMREQLGIAISEDILPLTDSAGYLPPFWLDAGVALRARRA